MTGTTMQHRGFLIKNPKRARSQVGTSSLCSRARRNSPCLGNTVAKVIQHFLFGGQLITSEQTCVLKREGTISRTLHNEPCFTPPLHPATLDKTARPGAFSSVIACNHQTEEKRNDQAENKIKC